MEHSELPEKWKTIPIKELFSFVLGGDWGKDPLKFEDKHYELVLCIRGSEIKNWATKNSSTAVERLIKKTSLERRTLIPGDVLIEISGGGPDQPVGRTIYIDENSLNNDKDIPLVCTNFLRMMRFHPSLNSKYIQQFLQLFYDSGSIIKYQGGSNNLRNLKFKDFETIKIPIAPRPEQDRIVSKVDVLMAQVETMQKSLELIPQLLKDFRQQVLTQAVTGKLTEEWREGRKLEKPKLDDNGKYELGFKCVYPKEWDIYPIGNIFNFQQGMQIAKNTRLTEQIHNSLPILRIKNYHDGFVKDVEFVQINEKSLIAEKDDIILTRTGESRGWVLTGFRGVFHNNTFRINFPKEAIQGRFVKIVLDSRQTQNFIKYNSGRTGQPDLSHKSFGPCPFIIPSVEEQNEIIRRVESLFVNADVIEEKYKAIKTKINTLPQAILHNAFKGELVEQLERDGDARELLKEIEGLKKN